MTVESDAASVQAALTGSRSDYDAFVNGASRAELALLSLVFVMTGSPGRFVFRDESMVWNYRGLMNVFYPQRCLGALVRGIDEAHYIVNKSWHNGYHLRDNKGVVRPYPPESILEFLTESKDRPSTLLIELHAEFAERMKTATVKLARSNGPASATVRQIVARSAWFGEEVRSDIKFLCNAEQETISLALRLTLMNDERRRRVIGMVRSHEACYPRDWSRVFMYAYVASGATLGEFEALVRLTESPELKTLTTRIVRTRSEDRRLITQLI